MLAARTLTLRGAAVAALLLCFAIPASAATATWNGSFTDWFDGPVNDNRWTGDEPGPSDTAVFNTSVSAEMTSDNSIGALTMSGGADLSTNGFSLTVDGLAQLAGASTDLTVSGSGSILIADSVTVNSGAEIFLRGGSLLVVEETGDGLLDVNLGGEISGNGIIFLGDSPTSVKSLFDLDGTLTATGFAPGFGSPPPAATLQIIGNNANVRANLDGAGGGGDGTLIVNHNATLDVNVPLSDPFDGTLELRVNSKFDMSSPWTFGGAGVSQINVNSGAVGFPVIAAAPAHIAGAALTQTGGTITLNQADEVLVFDAVLNQTGGTIANSGTIVFNANANLTGGAFSNNGSLTVNPGKTVEISNNFDIDGTGPGGATIGAGARLDLSLSGSADEIFNGVVRLNGGTLEVTTSDDHWEVDNLIVGANTGASTIDGESVTPHNITVGANSSLQINAPMSFDVGSGTVAAGASLFLAGPVTYNQTGADWTGPGSVFPQVTTVAGGVVDVTTGVYKLDLGPHTIEPFAAMHIDVGNIDAPGNPASDTYDHNTITINGSLFRVTVADGEWELGDQGVIILDRPAGGNMSQLGGSTLRVTTGAINVQGDADLVASVILTEGAAITIVDDATLVSRLNVLTLQGGDVVDSINRSTKDSVLDLQGTLSVTGVSTIDVETFLWDHGPTTISRTGNLSILGAEIQEGGVQNLTQLYRGTTDINGGRLFVDLDQLMDNNWTMDGTMNFNKSTAEQPTLATNDFLIIGDNSSATAATINVTGAGQSNIDAVVLLNADAIVTIGAGSLLNMSDDVTFLSQFNVQNASFTGAGTWRFAGGASFERPTTINMPAGTVDFAAGATIETPTTLNLGTLTSISAAININIGMFGAGSLVVNLTNPASSWTVNSGGSIAYNGDATMRTFLDGSDLNLNGSLVVAGQGAIGARLAVGGPPAMVTIANGGTLQLLEFPNTINGGTINGPGTLNALTNSALFGYGIINAPIDFDGNSDLRAQDGTLNVNGQIIDVGEIGTNNNQGILNIPNVWNTNVANSVQMAGGALTGATITNDGLIEGFGLVDVSQLINNGTISASSQTLTLDRHNSTNGYDWDGAADTGTLNAQLGDLTLVATSAATFNGDMNIDDGHVLFVDGFPMELDAASQITFRGGVYRANFPQIFEGRIDTDVLNVAEIDAPGTFAAGSQLIIDATLQLRQSMTIAQGAAVGGLGTITNLGGATLTIANAVDLDLTLDNRGTLAIGASPGQITGNDYLQSATAAWNVEIGGIAAGQFDRMTLSGQAFLAGALNIALLPGFMPVFGQTFDILTAPGGVTGVFTAVDEPDNMPLGLLFDVIYNPTFVRLQVVNSPIFSADFDRDGDVDNFDFTAWKNSFGVNAGADANLDGRSDGRDFLAWQQQRGSVPVVPAGEPVPEPAALFMSAACLAAMAHLNKRLTRHLPPPAVAAPARAE